MKKNRDKNARNFFLTTLLFSTVLVALLYAYRTHISQSKDDGRTLLVDGCKINLEFTPLDTTMRVIDKPLHIDLLTEPVNWTGGSAIYSHPTFEVAYQTSRKIYDQDKGFVLCPEDHCQSPEMILEPLEIAWGVDEIPKDKCELLAKFVTLYGASYNTVWSSFTLGSYPGYVKTRFPDENEPFNSLNEKAEMVGVFSANGHYYFFYLEPASSQHLSILESFQPK